MAPPLNTASTSDGSGTPLTSEELIARMRLSLLAMPKPHMDIILCTGDGYNLICEAIRRIGHEEGDPTAIQFVTGTVYGVPLEHCKDLFTMMLRGAELGREGRRVLYVW